MANSANGPIHDAHTVWAVGTTAVCPEFVTINQVVYERVQDIAPMSEIQVNYSPDSVTVWITNEPIGVVSWLRTTVTAHSTSGLE